MSDDYLVRHCAPTLAGIKTGSIFTCPYESKDALLHMVRGLNKRLASKGLRILPLRLSEKKALIYIFRPKCLSKDLSDAVARDVLIQHGYDMKVITGIQNAVADRKTHKAVHDKYIKIGWKVRQAAFAESHKDELDCFNKAFRYLKKQGVDLNVDLDALQTEYDKLKATHTELAGQLAAVKEELQPMKDIRYWVGKVLTPEQSEVQKKPEPKHSPSEQIKFYQEQEKEKQEQKSPQHKKQNMEL